MLSSKSFTVTVIFNRVSIDVVIFLSASPVILLLQLWWMCCRQLIYQDVIDLGYMQEAGPPGIRLESLLTLFVYVWVCVCVCAPTDLFSLFASDLSGHAAREDIEAVLQVLDGEVPTSLKKCFSEVSKCHHRDVCMTHVHPSQSSPAYRLRYLHCITESYSTS